MNALAPYWKAVVAFVAPGAVVFTSAVQPNSIGGEHITGGELVTAVAAMFITAAGVYAATNTPATAPARKDEDAPEHRAG